MAEVDKDKHLDDDQYNPLKRCVKCKVLFSIRVWKKNMDGRTYGQQWSHYDNKEVRVVCPRCTLILLEEKFGRLG